MNIPTFAPKVRGGKVIEMITSGQLGRDYVFGNGEVEILFIAHPNADDRLPGLV
jgi:hypothetical protein